MEEKVHYFINEYHITSAAISQNMNRTFITFDKTIITKLF